MEPLSPIAKYRFENDRMSQEGFGALFDPALDKSTIHRWEKNGVPTDRVLAVESVTGISRHALRPDVFGPFPEAAE